MDDGVTPLHGGGHGDGIGHVPLHDGGVHAMGIEGGRDSTGIADQDPHVVTGALERGHRMRPDEPGRPGHENQHASP